MEPGSLGLDSSLGLWCRSSSSASPVSVSSPVGWDHSVLEWVRLESVRKLQDLPRDTKLSGNVLCCPEALGSPGGEGLGVEVQCSGELERVRVKGTMHMNQEGWG